MDLLSRNAYASIKRGWRKRIRWRRHWNASKHEIRLNKSKSNNNMDIKAKTSSATSAFSRPRQSMVREPTVPHAKEKQPNCSGNRKSEEHRSEADDEYVAEETRKNLSTDKRKNRKSPDPMYGQVVKKKVLIPSSRKIVAEQKTKQN